MTIFDLGRRSAFVLLPALLACGSAAPDANAPTTTASAVAEPPVAAPSAVVAASAASAGAVASADAPLAGPPSSGAPLRDCFCAAWSQPDNRGEVCTEVIQRCMRRRRLVDEKLSAGECLPQKRETCTGFGCEGEKCYRLK